MRGRASDYIFLGGMFLVGLVFFKVFYQPAMKEVDMSSIRLRSTMAEISKSEDFTRGLEDLQKYLDEYEGAIADLDRLVPGRINRDARLREINDMVTSCDLRSRSIRPDPSVDLGNVTAHPLTIVISGSYEKIVRFLFEAESLPRYTRVTRMTVEPHREQAGMLVAEIELTSYSIVSVRGETS